MISKDFYGYHDTFKTAIFQTNLSYRKNIKPHHPYTKAKQYPAQKKKEEEEEQEDKRHGLRKAVCLLGVTILFEGD